MFKLAAHFETNLRNISFAERWQVARQIGITGCEFVWRNHGIDEVVNLQQKTGLTVSALGGTTGFKVGTGRPVLLEPTDRSQLTADVTTAIQYAEKLSCKQLIMVVGNFVEGWNMARHRSEAVAGLKSIVPLLEQAGVTVVIEPLNTLVNHVGHYLSTTAEAFAIVDEVGSTHVKVLYDIYHMQIMEGNLINTIQAHHDKIGYYHVAGVPGRHEPIGGEVNFSAVFEAIAKTGYDGYIGLEYQPTLDPEVSLRQVVGAYSTYK